MAGGFLGLAVEAGAAGVLGAFRSRFMGAAASGASGFSAGPAPVPVPGLVAPGGPVLGLAPSWAVAACPPAAGTRSCVSAGGRRGGEGAGPVHSGKHSGAQRR